MTGRGERSLRWVYGQVWSVLTEAFRVPKEPPMLPAGAGTSVATFRPSPGFLAYLKLQFWIVLTLIDGALLVLWIVTLVAIPILGILLAPIFLAVAVLPDVVAYVALHLRYDTTWYVLSDRSLRIRRGIWVIRESTLTFENVQNVTIKQGPLQRHFGIANLVVRTAGGGDEESGGHEAGAHVGLVEGVDDARRIRDLIMARVRRSRAAGLGDELRPTTVGSRGRGAEWTAAHIDCLRAIRREIAALG